MLTLISRNTLLYTTLLNTNLQDHNTSKHCELIDLLFSEKNTEKISLLKHINTHFMGVPGTKYFQMGSMAKYTLIWGSLT